MKTFLVGLAAGAALMGCVVTSAVADAATITAVAMYSDAGDYIGQGQSLVFMPPHDTVSVNGNAGDVTVVVDSPGGYNFEFAAPQGQTLQAGVYDGGMRAAFRAGAAPGIDIYGDGRGCNTTTGRFEVKDFHVGSSGVPDRLWIVYEEHCEGGAPALFGEVRVGEPADSGAVTPAPAFVRWPEEEPGFAESTVPVEFLAGTPTTLSAASLGGEDPGDFTIREDDCRGQALTVGTECAVFVRFTPRSPGTKAATLTVSDAAGVSHTVPLEGWTDGGTTQFTATSDNGDWVGGGSSYDLTPSDSTFDASGTREGLSFAAGGFNGSFHPGPGDIFTAGATYDGAQRDAFRNNAPGMEVDYDSHGCNTITGSFAVVSASFLPDGTMRSIDLTFTQHCDGATPALHGELKWKAGDTVAPAAWMSPDGYPVSPASPAPSGGGASSSGASGSSGGSSSNSSQVGGSSPTSGPSSASASTTTSNATSAPGSATPSAPSLTAVTRASAQQSTSPPANGSLTRAKLHQLLTELVSADRKFQSAVAVLARGAAKPSQSRRARTAGADLVRAITALRSALRHAPSVLGRAERTRVLGALGTLAAVLAAERNALGRARGGGFAVAARIDRRRASAERRALRVLSAAP